MVNLRQRLITHWPVWAIVAAVLVAFYPSVIFGKTPLNGNNLVAFFSPWIYQKWEGYPTGVPAKPGILDQLRIYYPYMRLTQESYRLGQLPLWNPYNFAGNPHMAEWQSGVFYPLHIFLPFLPLPVYWTLFQMTGFFLAALFTFWYLRNLKIGKLASLLSGLTYSFSTFMFTWNAEVVPTPHSILWLPAMLLCADKFLTEGKGKYWFFFLGSGVASILSGYWQTTLYVLSTAFLYGLVRSLWLFPQGNGKPKTKSALLLVAAFPLMAGLTAFHLLPTAELYQRSSRPLINLRADLQEFIKGYLLKLHWLATLIVPDFFGNPSTRNTFSYSNGTYYEWSLFVGTLQIVILPFLLFLKNRSLKLLAAGFVLLTVVAGSFSFDLTHARLVYDLKLPVLSTGIANRILFVPAFGLSVLAGFALHGWMSATEKERRRGTILTVLLGMVLFAGLWLFLWKWAPSVNVNTLRFPETWYRVSLRNSVIPTLTFIAGSGVLLVGVWKKRLLFLSALLLVGGATLQNIYQFEKFTPFTPQQFVYPSHSTTAFLQEKGGIDRYLGYNGTFMNYNFATQFQLYTIEGYDSLNDYRRAHLFASARSAGDLTTELSRSADVTLDQELGNSGVLRMMQLTGTKYLVDYPQFPDATDKSIKPTLPSDKERLVFEDGDWKIYEYLDAFPRAFLVGSYEVITDDQDLAWRLFDEDLNLRETVLLIEAPPGVMPQPDPGAFVEVARYTPNSIAFRTRAETDQLLFLSDTYYPGWKSTIDGKPTPVLMADYAFRAIPLPAGEHEVEMYYVPETFTNGLLIAGATILITFLIYKVWVRDT